MFKPLGERTHEAPHLFQKPRLFERAPYPQCERSPSRSAVVGSRPSASFGAASIDRDILPSTVVYDETIRPPYGAAMREALAPFASGGMIRDTIEARAELFERT
jgi:hypothetical protein